MGKNLLYYFVAGTLIALVAQGLGANFVVGLAPSTIGPGGLRPRSPPPPVVPYARPLAEGAGFEPDDLKCVDELAGIQIEGAKGNENQPGFLNHPQCLFINRGFGTCAKREASADDDSGELLRMGGVGDIV